MAPGRRADVGQLHGPAPGDPGLRHAPAPLDASHDDGWRRPRVTNPLGGGAITLQPPDALQRLYRTAPGPSLKSEGTNVCGSAGSVRSACCRGVSGTSGGGTTRACDHAIWETQYLKSRVRRSWLALHGAVPCITASENNTTDPVGTSGLTTQEAFSGASWIWRGSLKLLL